VGCCVDAMVIREEAHRLTTKGTKGTKGTKERLGTETGKVDGGEIGRRMVRETGRRMVVR
jgi:hypothetical protein